MQSYASRHPHGGSHFTILHAATTPAPRTPTHVYRNALAVLTPFQFQT